MKKHLLTLFLICLGMNLTHAQGIVYPAIQGYGAVNEVPFDVEKPDPTKQYKLVVELGNKLSTLEEVSDDLDYAARMYNLHIYAGVPAENIQLVLVVYSGSTPVFLSNEEYLKRFERANPNAKLLEEFQKNGVELIVCGQSMMKQKLVPEMIFPGVKMAVSRFTATTNLMVNGYQVVVL